ARSDDRQSRNGCYSDHRLLRTAQGLARQTERRKKGRLVSRTPQLLLLRGFAARALLLCGSSGFFLRRWHRLFLFWHSFLLDRLWLAGLRSLDRGFGDAGLLYHGDLLRLRR